MGQLYDAKLALERIIAERKLDPADVKGTVSLRSGLLLAFVRAETPDDPVKLDKLRAVVRQLLGVDV